MALQEIAETQRLNRECVHNDLSLSSLEDAGMIEKLKFQCLAKSNERSCYLCHACRLHIHLGPENSSVLAKETKA